MPWTLDINLLEIRYLSFGRWSGMGINNGGWESIPLN
jgi:hypothetical protein